MFGLMFTVPPLLFALAILYCLTPVRARRDVGEVIMASIMLSALALAWLGGFFVGAGA